MRFRSAGWIAGSLILGAALIAPAAALAQTGNQTNVSSESGDINCTGGPNGNITVDDQHVGWLFVHTQVSGPGTLTAKFTNAGTVTASSYDQGGVKYLIITGRPDTLESFSDNLNSPDGKDVLTLSHICRTVLPTPSPSIEITPSPSINVTPSPSINVTPSPSATEPEITPSPSTATTKPSSSIEAETGTPRITPPPTDVSGTGTSSGSGWGMAMLALGGLAALAMVVRPARKRR